MSRLTVSIPAIDYGLDSSIQFPPLLNSVQDLPDKFYRWGSVQDAPFHGFVDDWRLEAIWRDRDKQVDKVALSGFAIAPDYTVDTNAPLIYAAYQVWRSRTVAAWWSMHGVYVVPVLQWSRLTLNSFLFSGLQDCEVVAVRSPTAGYVDEWRQCAKQYLFLNSPKLVLHFGTKAGLDVWPCAVNMKLNPKINNQNSL